MVVRSNIVYVVHLLFVTYTLLLFLRVISSWFPFHWQRYRVVQFLAFYTDPYLALFRRWIPPIGGMLDLSPVAAFIFLRFFEMAILWILR